MMFRKLPAATFIMYALRLDEWILYFALLSNWYFEIVMLVAKHCGDGCNIPNLVSKMH